MSAHTPGPWTMRPDTGLAIFGADGEWLMSVHRPVEELRANACLIAAAPEMAVMLADYIYLHDQMKVSECECIHCVGARALLARIDGES
jgi:hypothetical protein